MTIDVDGGFQKGVDSVNSHLILGSVLADDGLDRIYPGNYSNGYKEATSLKVTEGSLDLVSAKTYASVSKLTSNNNKLQFKAADIDNGNTSVVCGYNSTNGTNTVIRDINDSNVMVPRVVIHIFDGYL